MAQIFLQYRGDTIDGIINLRAVDATTGATSLFPIETGSVIELLWPAADTSQPVVLSTANSGEITIIDPDLSTISFHGPASKSLQMAVGKKLSLDCVVKQAISGKIVTFEYAGQVTVMDRANPE